MTRRSVLTITSNCAGEEKGFMTTANDVSSRPAGWSGRNQVRRELGTHRSPARAGADFGPWTTAAAPTRPPKYSTSLVAPASVAGTSRYTCRREGTEKDERPRTPPLPNVVTRAITSEGPGFVTTTQPWPPPIPPCGQNHAPVSVFSIGPTTAAFGPLRSRKNPEAATTTTNATTETTRPRTEALPSGNDGRLSGEPEDPDPEDGEERDLQASDPLPLEGDAEAGRLRAAHEPHRPAEGPSGPYGRGSGSEGEAPPGVVLLGQKEQGIRRGGPRDRGPPQRLRVSDAKLGDRFESGRQRRLQPP